MTKNFQFTDGVYLSFEDFQANKPIWTSEEVALYGHLNPQSYLTQVERIVLLENDSLINMDSVWGYSLDGIPFVHLPKEEVYKELPAFAALKLRGKICYFTYPDWRSKEIPIAAYNPVTGRPFLKGKVEREEQVVVEKIIHFETGEILDFTVDNFLAWIQDDEKLMETVNELPSEDKQEKLFKCLLIYVDRNKVEINRNKNKNENKN